MMANFEQFPQKYPGARDLDPHVIKDFQETIFTHYHANPRPMPWRETDDPYRVLISEVMLQQTQVERVKAKYSQFLTAFPNLIALANAPLSDILHVWQGLGYNRRAIALKRCAEEVRIRFAGTFPKTSEELQSLPGIGPYTARAIAAFAFGVAEPFIETNIRTVFIHFFFQGREKIRDKEILPLVAATLVTDNPRQWYYALMDYGVMLKQRHPNPGRRSAHHVRQSRFEGSNRQLRSSILKAIMAKPGVTIKSLVDNLLTDREAVERNLVTMEREGFIQRQGRGYLVRDGAAEGEQG